MANKFLDYDGLEEVVEQIEAKYAKINQLPVVNNGILTINKNGALAGAFTANQSANTTIDLIIPTQASDVGALPNTTKYGASLDLSINSSTYVVTAQLKDQDGNNLGTPQTIDLPIESVVVSGSYDAQTKEVVLTLQSGSTIRFSVADLVSGLQSEITSTNKLSADLVDDTSTTHKFVTASDKTNWNGKQDALTAGDNITITNNVISAEKGVIDLVSDTPIRITNLHTGVYRVKGISVVYYNGSSNNDVASIGGSNLFRDELLFVQQEAADVFTWFSIHTGTSPCIAVGKTTLTSGTYRSIDFHTILTSTSSVIDNLNESTVDYTKVLSAHQGYVLKQEIDTLPDTAITTSEIDALFN